MGRRLLVPVLLVIAGTVLGCLALEGLLHGAALIVSITHPHAAETWTTTGRLRVLCLGDSNTYGLYMRDRADAYPQQLERMWNAANLSPQIEVLNAGYPGMNSSRLRQNLRPLLEAVRPDVVIIMVGANDYWTVRAPVDAARSWSTALGDLVRQHSRLYRLLYMAWRGVDQRQFVVPDQRTISAQPEQAVRYGDAAFTFGYERGQRQRDNDAQLIANLEAMAEEARRFHARPVFLTYPSKEANYGDGGRLIRVAAEAAAVPVVDVQKVFLPFCAKEPCPEWFYPDHHATRAGYQLIAQSLVEQRLGIELASPP